MFFYHRHFNNFCLGAHHSRLVWWSILRTESGAVPRGEPWPISRGPGEYKTMRKTWMLVILTVYFVAVQPFFILVSDTSCSRDLLFPIPFVPDTFCIWYLLFPIPLVSATFCFRYLLWRYLCADTFCADTFCANTFCADTFCDDTFCTRILFLFFKGQKWPQVLQDHVSNFSKVAFSLKLL